MKEKKVYLHSYSYTFPGFHLDLCALINCRFVFLVCVVDILCVLEKGFQFFQCVK